MTSVHGSLLAGAALAAALAGLACGGGPLPVAPTPPADAAPPPPASPPPQRGEEASAQSCPIGKGVPTASCSKSQARLLEAVDAAIDRLVRERPELFDPGAEAGEGTRQYRVLDREAYLDGVIANLRAAGLCAQRGLDLQRLQVKNANDFSEDWNVWSSNGFIRRGGGAYLQTCTPAVFPVDPPDLIARVRTAFFSFECAAGVVPPHPTEGRLPLGCDGLVTATPKLANDDDVPPWIHGPEIEWDLREGEEVVRVDPDTRFSNPFNKILRPRGEPGHFYLCATVLGKEGCLFGRVIP
jgi:hypothetical protein